MWRGIFLTALPLAGLVLGSWATPAADAESDTVPAGDSAAEPVAAPEVRILSGLRTTLGDAPFVSLSCEIKNPAERTVAFVGYRPDAFDPPLAEGQVSPIYVVQVRRGEAWEEYPIGWCGTGMGHIELARDAAGSFGVSVPVEPAWDAVRVGVAWSEPLDFDTAEQDAYSTAWSEPLTLAEIDAPPTAEGAQPGSP
jgi:hypothetical protein